MKLILLLVIQLMFWTQNVEAQERCAKSDDVDFEFNSMDSTSTISNLWKKMKEIGTFAQNTIIDIGDKAIKKLYALMIGLRNSIAALVNLLVTQLEKVKDDIYDAIRTAWETAGDIKQCVMKDKDAIRALVKKLTTRVTTCIIKNVKKSVFGACRSKKSCNCQEFQTINKAEFMKGAIDKINQCVENDKEAGQSVNFIMKMATMKSAIRDLAGKVLEIFLQCTSEGILDVSAAIADEVQNIYNCVIDKRTKSLASKLEL